VAVAKTDEAAEAHHSVGHAAGHLVDHEMADRADLAPVVS
jgi:hypothetical protein